MTDPKHTIAKNSLLVSIYSSIILVYQECTLYTSIYRKDFHCFNGFGLFILHISKHIKHNSMFLFFLFTCWRNHLTNWGLNGKSRDAAIVRVWFHGQLLDELWNCTARDKPSFPPSHLSVLHALCQHMEMHPQQSARSSPQCSCTAGWMLLLTQQKDQGQTSFHHLLGV